MKNSTVQAMAFMKIPKAKYGLSYWIYVVVGFIIVKNCVKNEEKMQTKQQQRQQILPFYIKSIPNT